MKETLGSVVGSRCQTSANDLGPGHEGLGTGSTIHAGGQAVAGDVTVLHGDHGIGFWFPTSCRSHDSDGLRASEFQHSVQVGSSDGDLGHLGFIRARSKGVANYVFVSADLRLDPDPAAIAAGLLPAHPAVLGDDLEVAVPLCGSHLGRSARDRGCPWRHDDRSITVALGNRPVDLVLIVSAVAGERSERIAELVEKRTGSRAVVNFFLASSTATISPLSPSTPICRFRQDRRREAPCFSTSHSPAPPSFTPVLSTSRCSGPVPSLRRSGTCSVLARRLKVEWSGTARSNPSNSMMEPMSPSVCRSARPKTARSVSAVVIAKLE